MKQRPLFRIAWAACILILFQVELAVTADSNRPLRVQGTSGEWIVDPRGMSLAPTIPGCPASEATREFFWAVVLEPAPGGGDAMADVMLESTAQASPRIEAAAEELDLTYGKATFDILLSVKVRCPGSDFEIGGEILHTTCARSRTRDKQ